MNAPAGNRTRVCTVAGYYSTTRPLVLVASFTELSLLVKRTRKPSRRGSISRHQIQSQLRKCVVLERESKREMAIPILKAAISDSHEFFNSLSHTTRLLSIPKKRRLIVSASASASASAPSEINPLRCGNSSGFFHQVWILNSIIAWLILFHVWHFIQLVAKCNPSNQHFVFILEIGWELNLGNPFMYRWNLGIEEMHQSSVFFVIKALSSKNLSPLTDCWISILSDHSRRINVVEHAGSADMVFKMFSKVLLEAGHFSKRFNSKLIPNKNMFYCFHVLNMNMFLNKIYFIFFLLLPNNFCISLNFNQVMINTHIAIGDLGILSVLAWIPLLSCSISAAEIMGSMDMCTVLVHILGVKCSTGQFGRKILSGIFNIFS